MNNGKNSGRAAATSGQEGVITMTPDGCLTTVTSQGLTVEVRTRCESAPVMGRMMIGAAAASAMWRVFGYAWRTPAEFRSMLGFELKRELLCNLPGYVNEITTKRRTKARAAGGAK